MPPLPKSIIEKEKDLPTSRINVDVVSNPKISPVPKILVKRASQALLSHLSKTATSTSTSQLGRPKSLLEEDESVSISISVHLKRVPPKQSGSFGRPASIGPLPHSLLDPEDGIEICLIAKDPGDEIRTKLLEVPVAGLTRVLAVGKLKKDYRDFSRRRELVSQFDMFLCDDRVVTFLPQLTGKAFYEKRKTPIPVRVSSNNASAIAAEIERARDSTHTLLGAGQTVSLKIGHSRMTAEQLSDNIVYASSRLVNLLPKKWRGIMSMHLLATGTVALPLYKNLPRIEADAADEDDDDDDEDEVDEEKEEMEEKVIEKKKEIKIIASDKNVPITQSKSIAVVAPPKKTSAQSSTTVLKSSSSETSKRQGVLPPALPTSRPTSIASKTVPVVVATKSAPVAGVKRRLPTEEEEVATSTVQVNKKAKSITSSGDAKLVGISTVSSTTSKTIAPAVTKSKVPISSSVPKVSASTVTIQKKSSVPLPPPVVLKRMPPQPALGVLRTEHKKMADKVALKKAIKETKGFS